jgi:CBS domain-containing protein
MKVANLMTKDVACCRTDEPLSAAAERMWTRDCGVLPVLDAEGKAIGMVTDRDICMSTWMNGAPPQALTIATAMSRSLHSCSPEDSLDKAEQLMRTNQIRRLPVIDSKGELCGILSLADIVRQAERGQSAGNQAARLGAGQRDGVGASEVTSTLANIVRPHPESPPAQQAQASPSAH